MSFLAMRVKAEEPAHSRPHRCDDFCGTGCQFCGERICLDDSDTFEKKRIGDTMEHLLICKACDESEAA